jgi:hypothetical protein
MASYVTGFLHWTFFDEAMRVIGRFKGTVAIHPGNTVADPLQAHRCRRQHHCSEMRMTS